MPYFTSRFHDVVTYHFRGAYAESNAKSFARVNRTVSVEARACGTWLVNVAT